MIELIKQNLITCGAAMIIFIISYVANICFSLYLNISMLEQKWEGDKFLKSIIKAAVFIVGMALLVVGLTTIPLFAGKIGGAIPEEFTDLFNALVIIGVVLYTSCKYLKEAFDKFRTILNVKEEDLEVLKTSAAGKYTAYTVEDVARLINQINKEYKKEPEKPKEENKEEEPKEEPKKDGEISMAEFIALVNESMK